MKCGFLHNTCIFGHLRHMCLLILVCCVEWSMQFSVWNETYYLFVTWRLYTLNLKNMQCDFLHNTSIYITLELWMLSFGHFQHFVRIRRSDSRIQWAFHLKVILFFHSNLGPLWVNLKATQPPRLQSLNTRVAIPPLLYIYFHWCRVKASITNHLRYYAPNLEKYKAVQFFYVGR
jgi:hypothetical protein